MRLNQNPFPHEPGRLTKERYKQEIAERLRQGNGGEPPSVISGTVAGVDQSTGELLVGREGGEIVRAEWSGEGSPLPGRPVVVTLGSGSRGNRRAIAQLAGSKLPGIVNINGIRQNPTALDESADDDGLDCSFQGSVTFELNPPEDLPPLEAEEEPEATGWACVEGTCVQQDGGVYASQFACITSGCRKTSWNCKPSVNGPSCVEIEGTGGAYPTRQLCEASCKGPTFNCLPVKGCTPAVDGKGQFASLAACKASGCEPNPRYSCIDGKCHPMGTAGEFENLAACEAAPCIKLPPDCDKSEILYSLAPADSGVVGAVVITYFNSADSRVDISFQGQRPSRVYFGSESGALNTVLFRTEGDSDGDGRSDIIKLLQPSGNAPRVVGLCEVTFPPN